MMPLSTFRNGNTETNFWTYSLLQQGIWGALTSGSFEIIFHAAFSSLIPDGRVPRREVWFLASLACPASWLLAVALRFENSTSAPILIPITPPVIVIFIYAIIVRESINQGPQCIIFTRSSDLDTATFGEERDNVTVMPNLHTTGSNLNEMSTPLLKKQFFLATTYSICFCLVYTILEVFAVAFQLASTKETQRLWFVGFLIINVIMKEIMLFLGRELDKSKRGGASLYYHAAMMCSLFYFSFYRLLFESVNSYTTFAILQFLHVFVEWWSYVLRPSRPWLKFFGALTRRAPWCAACCRWDGDQNGPKTRNWVCYRTTVFAIRALVFLYSSIAFLIFQAFVVFGWNRYYFGEIGDMSQTDFILFVVFLLISALVEVVNVVAMNMLFFEPNQLHLADFTISLFHHGRPWEFATIVVILTSTLFCNVFVPFVQLDFGLIDGNREYAGIAAIATTLCLIIVTRDAVSAAPAPLGPRNSTKLEFASSTNKAAPHPTTNAPVRLPLPPEDPPIVQNHMDGGVKEQRGTGL
jgi:hypothetical protein